MLRKIAKALCAPYDVWVMILAYLPGDVGFALRYRYWRKRLKSAGRDIRFGVGVRFQNPGYISIGDNCWIDDYVVILAGPDAHTGREKSRFTNADFRGEPGVVHIGSNVHIAPFCVISGISAGVYISDDCNVASGSKIYAFSHHFRSKKNPTDRAVSFGPMVPPERQCLIEGPVMIGRNAGIALNCIVLPGVHIPQDCFVCPNSVVKTGAYPPNSLLEGTPAKVIGERFVVRAAPVVE